MKEIKLTQGQIAFVDDEDYDRVNQYKWCVSKVIRNNMITYYAKRAVTVDGKQKTQRLHNFIMGENLNAEIDHKDGNRLNCTKDNLRFSTHQQNTMNKHRHKKCKTSYRGVYKNTNCKTFSASIGFNKKRIYLGSFSDEISAAKAYDNAAIKYFGEYANINLQNKN